MRQAPWGSQCASVHREAELRHIAVHHAGRSGIVSEDKQEIWCHSRRGPPRKISSARRSTRPGSSTSAGTLPAGRAAPRRCVIANGARLARFGAAHHGLCAVLTKQELLSYTFCSYTPVVDQRCSMPGSHNPQQNRSEEHTSELQSRLHLVCRLLLEKKKKRISVHCDCKRE